MFFFDFAMYVIVGAVLLALGIGAISVVNGFLRPVKQPAVVGDCRDETLILHGEGVRRDC